jgi:tungstate transport system ATP-binding protein
MNPQLHIVPIQLHAVSWTAKTKRVIKEITCEIARAPGLTVILGPNGAGKSLLLQLCHGILQPHDGHITWGGRDDPGLSQQRQSMVFQRPIHLRRTVAANLDFALKLKKIAAPERRQKIDQALQMTGLSRYRKTAARSLSFGEQQRLALARAWVVSPELMILDEPTANLDPAAARLVEDVLAEVVATGARVLMSSHDLAQARRLADEVIFMHRGRIKEQGPAADFFAGPENDLAQAFLRGELLWWRRRAIYDAQEGKTDDPF